MTTTKEYGQDHGIFQVVDTKCFKDLPSPLKAMNQPNVRKDITEMRIMNFL